MIAVVFDGPDGVGKTTQASLVVRTLTTYVSTALVPSLNVYLERSTGLDHAQRRAWRLHQVDVDEYAGTVLAAHAQRLAGLTLLTPATVYIQDRGLCTIEAGCAALADLRGTTLAPATFRALRDSPEFLVGYRIVRVALLYARSISASMRAFRQREPRADQAYYAYQQFLQTRLVTMSDEGRFDHLIWIGSDSISVITEQLFAILEREMRSAT